MLVREADLRTLGTGSGSETREATEPEPEDGGSEEDPWLSLQHGARIALHTYIVEFHNWLALSAGMVTENLGAGLCDCGIINT